MLEAFPAKPKGMRRRTYDQLRRAHDLAQGKAMMGVTQFLIACIASCALNHRIFYHSVASRQHSYEGGALLEGAALAGVTPKSNLGRNNHMDAITFSPTLATARMLLELAERHASTREPQT